MFLHYLYILLKDTTNLNSIFPSFDNDKKLCYKLKRAVRDLNDDKKDSINNDRE